MKSLQKISIPFHIAIDTGQRRKKARNTNEIEAKDALFQSYRIRLKQLKVVAIFCNQSENIFCALLFCSSIESF